MKMKYVLIYTIAFIWLFWTLFPLYFMAVTSVKTQMEFFTTSPWQFPAKPTFENFKNVLSSGFLRNILNSVIVSGISVLLNLFVSTMASFAFARFNHKVFNWLFLIFVAGLSIPLHVTLIPIFVITKRIGLYDTLMALMGPYIASQLPVTILVLTNFMRGIPREIEDAAKIEGCNSWDLYWRIILPLSKPAIVSLGMFNLVMYWNEFVYALTLLSTPSKWTMTLGLFQFQGRYSINVPGMLSAVTISTLPVLLAYIFFQDKIVEGMTMGATKG